MPRTLGLFIVVIALALTLVGWVFESGEYLLAAVLVGLVAYILYLEQQVLKYKSLADSYWDELKRRARTEAANRSSESS